MNTTVKIWVYPFVLIIALLTLTNSCKKETSSSSKKNPEITWADPSDIFHWELLCATQLNASANVPGTFSYTPTKGSKLNPGKNQDLKVEFKPSDMSNYNSISKIVHINVLGSTTTVVDIDGNVYHTVTIGSQVWMVENLKTTKYNDGSAIPMVPDNSTWTALSSPGFCWYKNDASTYKNTYGALYNWYTVNTGKLAPPGWHVPTDEEWTTLTAYLGGEGLSGGKMKSTGTIEAGTGLWQEPNTWATNESGFTGIPAGYRYIYGQFSSMGSAGYWWSSSERNTTNAWFRLMMYTYPSVYRYDFHKNNGFSVRCLQDI